MARGKSITVFLMDGKASGKIKSTITNWNGIAYKIPRGCLSECKDLDAFKQSGVYFMFDNILLATMQKQMVVCPFAYDDKANP